jgi:hypothetical protein
LASRGGPPGDRRYFTYRSGRAGRRGSSGRVGVHFGRSYQPLLHDKHGPDPLLARSYASGWRLRRLVGDGSYAGEDVAGDAARHGATFAVAPRPRKPSGFVPIPLRWRVEQALGILTTRSRRLVRDWEQLPEVSETVMVIANLRRLIRAVARSR